MVVLAGVLSAGTAMFHTLRVSESYNEALRAELEKKGLASAATVQTVLDALCPDALQFT